MTRYCLYDCEKCAWHARNECKEYDYEGGCRDCPNHGGGKCNCLSQAEEGETQCPFFKEYIESETCKNLTEKNHVSEFICSNCGFMMDEFYRKEVDDGVPDYYEFEIKYCPNCGAKVVEE